MRTRLSFSSGYQLKIGLGMGYMFTSPLSRNVSGASLCILPCCELMHPSCCKLLTTIGLLFDSLCIFYFFTPFLYACFSESYCCFEQTTNKSNSREEGLILALGSLRSSHHGGKTQHSGRKKTSPDTRRREKAKSEDCKCLRQAPMIHILQQSLLMFAKLSKTAL